MSEEHNKESPNIPEKSASNSSDKNSDALQGDSRYSHISTNRSSAALRGALWSGINAIIPALLNSLVFIVSSRFLMPHDFGIIALAVSAVSLASAIAPAALGEALIQQLHIRKSHLDTVFWICTGFALFCYVLVVACSPIIASTMGQPEVAKFLPLLGLKLIFDLIVVVPNALIARAMSFHLIALRTIVATILSSIICIGLLLNGYGIWALAISMISVSIVGCIATFMGAKWLPGFEISKVAFYDLYKYGLFASGNRFLQLLSLDQLVIGSMVGPAPLGIFNFARRLFQILNDVIAGALTSVSHSLLSSLQYEKEKVRNAFLMATYGSSIISFPAFIGLAAVVGDAIPIIFGPQWSDAIWPTRWFCLIGLMSCIGFIQASLITSQGKSNWWFYYQLFKQISLIATIVFLFDKSISVIVAAIAIQTMLYWPITILMVSKIINLKVLTYLRQFLEPFFASLLMLLSVELMAHFLQPGSSLSSIGIEIATGAIVYSVSIFLMSREKLLMMWKKLLSKKNNKDQV